MTLQVFCFPFAGAGATLYRSMTLPTGCAVNLVSLQPSGREERFAEPLYADLGVAIDDLTAQLATAWQGGPFAMFGHSFGAVLAFEVTRRLHQTGRPLPQQLLVSGSQAPGTLLIRNVASLTDDEFVADVERLAGYEHPALADPDLRELVLPAMRSDVTLHEAYRPSAITPLPVPLVVLRGRNDALVSRADCDGWCTCTSAGWQYVEPEGGHMYLIEDPQAFPRLLARLCQGSVVEGAPA